MGYQPIEDYGLIGDMRTAALVGRNGSIDWFCYPDFDSPSLFAALLDDRRGGRFRIAPAAGDVTGRQMYWPETNVLITRFLNPEGVGEVQDFMPVGGEGDDPPRQIIRHVRVSRGRVRFALHCQPAFDYARVRATVHRCDQGVVFEGAGLAIRLHSPIPLEIEAGAVRGEFEIDAGQSVTFVLGSADADQSAAPVGEQGGRRSMEQTLRFWRQWLSGCQYRGRWRETVYRSALTLKLLTYQPTGAMVAAPTCSLPDEIGGTRNWDFRLTWIRDAAFTLYALMRLGFSQEAADFMHWLEQRYREDPFEHDGPLQVVYGIRGENKPEERILDHLEGYRQSGPVRIGNAAYKTLQLDIYGELLDAIYLYNKYGSPIGYDDWQRVRQLVDWICDNWHREDQGIWEVRGKAQHYTFSKVMCWVGLDRGLRLAAKRSLPADVPRWRKQRDAIYAEVMRKSWSEPLQSFVQAYDSQCLDGSSLIMPLVFFTAPQEPRMMRTIDAIRRLPRDGGLTSDGLVHRFQTNQQCGDGIEGGEGTFNMCSFWLVEAMTRSGRNNPPLLEQARLLFEQMLGYANHLGLFSEQTGHSGQALGNTPQAFTHLGLISAAFNLNRALEEQHR